MTVSWMQELEDRVREASARLHELRAENETLKQRIGALEDQLTAAPEAGGEVGEAGWKVEREEIRRRVEDLVAHLEQLLRDAD